MVKKASPVKKERSILTPRQTIVLRMIAQDMTNQQIADACGMTLGSIKVVVRDILARLRVPRRHLAAELGHRMDLIHPEKPGYVVSDD